VLALVASVALLSCFGGPDVSWFNRRDVPAGREDADAPRDGDAEAEVEVVPEAEAEAGETDDGTEADGDWSPEWSAEAEAEVDTGADADTGAEVDGTGDEDGAEAEADASAEAGAEADADVSAEAEAEADPGTPETDEGPEAHAEAGDDAGVDEAVEAEAGSRCGAPCAEGLACNEAWGICVAADCAGRGDFTPCVVETAPDRAYDVCAGGFCVSPGCGDTTCNAPAPHFPLADSGQRACRDSWGDEIACRGRLGSYGCGMTMYCGQDAQYGWDAAHDAAARFSRSEDVAGEPVVTDEVTGLAWQGCAAGASGADCAAGRATTWSWADALAWCDALAWGGRDDWGLPDPFEMQSIVNYGTSDLTTIDATAFPRTPAEWFWTSSSHAAPGYAWTLAFFDGHTASARTSDRKHVRCVRRSLEARAAAPRFVRAEPVPGEPIVTDAATGLVWQGCPLGRSGADCAGLASRDNAWVSALYACEGLSWGGHRDWYVPNVVELRTIVDEGAGSPAVDATAFPNTEPDGFLTSTYDAQAAGDAWIVDFDTGAVALADTSTTYYLRCVRRVAPGCPSEMALVPEGPFVMGSDPGEGDAWERPEHTVIVSSFCIDRTEVTSAQYRACSASGPCREPSCTQRTDEHPVTCVSWDDAQTYCAWLGKRLPTEAEWEKAARGGCEIVAPAACGPEDERNYPWGDATPTCDLASVGGCSACQPVGAHSPAGDSPYGPSDMAANAYEWTADWLDSAYYAECGPGCYDPPGPASSPDGARAIRGGDCISLPQFARVTYRNEIEPTARPWTLGFRCVRWP
jgi:formylglycine-generating enzyme required for sulfatase activity